MDFKWIILKFIFCTILLSKPNMGVDYIDKVLAHKNQF